MNRFHNIVSIDRVTLTTTGEEDGTATETLHVEHDNAFIIAVAPFCT